MITENEYTETGGTVCPNCESQEIEGGSVDIDAGIASQYVWCIDCNTNWTDLYKLVGYNQLSVES